MSPMSKEPLVLFSPLPPTRNGIADYCDCLMAPLAKHYDLFAVVANDATLPNTTDYQPLKLAEYEHRRAAFQSCAHIYQIGNNLDHPYMLPTLSRVPGLVTIHDMGLQHMLGLALPGGPAGSLYSDLMFDAYGSAGKLIAEDVTKWGWQSPIVHSELGFVPAFVRRSRGIVTHSLTGMLRVAAAGYDRPIYHLPHPYQDRVDPMAEDRETARRRARVRLDLPSDKIILLSLGFVTRHKRVDLTLEALSVLVSEGRPVVLVVAGQVSPDDFDLHFHVRRLGLEAHVIARGYVPDNLLMEYLAACDILVNLRYPTLGESSGSLANGLGMGCCIVVTDIGTFSELPDTCAVKVAVNEMTREGLLDKIVPIVCSSERRKRLEVNARKFAAQQLRLSTFIDGYLLAIDKTFSKNAKTPPVCAPVHRVRRLPKTARRKVEATASRLSREATTGHNLWWRSLMLPLPHPGDNLGIIGGGEFEVSLVKASFDWENVYLHDERNEKYRYYNALLVLLGGREFTLKYPDILKTIAKILPFGAILLLNIIDEDQSREDEAPRPFDVSELLEQYGFKTLDMENLSPEILEGAYKGRQPLQYSILAIKASNIISPPGSPYHEIYE